MENSIRLLYHKTYNYRFLSAITVLGFSTSLVFPSPGFTEASAARNKTIVVTASRIPTELSAVGNSVSVISAEDIQRMGARTVQDVLRHVPGLDVVQSGGDGQTSSVFIRGAKSEHTLVILDGVELNDPSSPSRGFDFANLATDNIESIEIFRGAGSPLYGSDAIGGVINITSSRGKPGAASTISAEAGSYGTFREKASVSTGGSLGRLSASVSRSDISGFSAASERLGNKENDGYENTTLSIKGNSDITENIDAEISARVSNSQTDIDNSGGVGGDDPNHLMDATEASLRGQVSAVTFDDALESSLGISLTDIDREVNNGTDEFHPDDSAISKFNGRLIKFDTQHNLHLSTSNIITAGAETEAEEADSTYQSESSFGPYSTEFGKEKARTNAIYLQDSALLLDQLNIVIGGRLDDHEEFGTAETYRLAMSLPLGTTGFRVKSSTGTGFKSPSLYQLYSEYGNTSLQPERGRSIDSGLEYATADRAVTADAVWFYNEFSQMIDFDSATYSYFNIARARTSGVELGLNADVSESLFVDSSYTWQETRDLATGEALVRRPTNKANAGLGYRYADLFEGLFYCTYTGKRYDNDFSSWPASKITLTDYFLFNLSGKVTIVDGLRLGARLENLFDKHYEEVLGYGSTGRGFYAGLEGRF